MVTRVSEGKFLEILEPGAQVNLPIELDVYDGGNPGTMLATLENAWDAALQVEMSEVGSGIFNLSRSDPKATPAILAKGNLVKVKTGGVYRAGWWIEEPVEILTSQREWSGENWQIKGRGALSCIERAVVYPPTWPIQPATFRAGSSGSNADAGTNTVSAAKPAGTINGDVMIAAVAWVGGSSKVVTPPPGWKEFRRINNGTALGVSLYMKPAGSAEGGSYQWAFSTVTQAVVNIVSLVHASTDATVYSFTSSSGGSGTAITHPGMSIEVVDGALLTFAAATAGSGDDPSSGVHRGGGQLGPSWSQTGVGVRPGPGPGGHRRQDHHELLWGVVDRSPPVRAVDGDERRDVRGGDFGAILETLLLRAQARGSLTDVTWDFDGVADSQGNPWPDTFDLTFHAGTSLLDVWRHLVSLGMEGGMSHDLKLSAFVDMARTLSGDVILRKGSHFLGDVANTGHYVDLRTRFIVEGAGGRLIEVTNPGLEAIPTIGRREGYLSMATSDAATDLSRAGEQALAIAALADNARSIPVDHGLLANGQYEPWEDYRLGDWIGLDPDGTGIVGVERVVGITINHRTALDYGVVLDLNSVSLEASVRMRRQMDALAKSSSSGGSGSSGLSLGGGSPGGGGSGAGTVSATAGDTPGFLLDKIDVAGLLTKVLAGVGGNRTVGLATRALVAPDLGTGTPDTSTFLRGDLLWAAPPGGGGGAYPPGSPDNPPLVPSAFDDEFTADPWRRRGPRSGPSTSPA